MNYKNFLRKTVVTGKIIKDYRIGLKMTQPEFARWLSRQTGENIDSRTVCRMEKFGVRNACHPLPPTPAVNELICASGQPYRLTEKIDVQSIRSNEKSDKDISKPLEDYMNRSYYIRGRKCEIEQIDGILAVQISSDNRGGTDLGVDKERLQANEEEVNAFETAGWRFIDYSEGHQRGVVAPQNSGSVFRRPEDGTLMIGTNELTIKLNPELSPGDVNIKLQEKGLVIKRQFKFATNSYKVSISDGDDTIDLANKLQEDEDFVYAEPVMVEHIAQRQQPADPNYDQQWQWKNNGINGTLENADVRAENAWNYSTGAGTRIAVIDNGFDIKHEDFAKAIDSASGYFVLEDISNSYFVQSLNENLYPNGDHGTICAGLVGARANNGIGGCGIAFDSKLVLISCLKDQVGTQETLARAIAYAADPSNEIDDADSSMGADIISCSLGSTRKENGRCIWDMSSVLQESIDFATSKGRNGLGTPIFWAISNDNVPLVDDQVCSHPNVIAVGRSNSSDLADGSAYGSELDFLAPGVNVYSTFKGDKYGRSTGTSYATPIVAGVAALLLNVNSKLTCNEIRQTLRDNCDQVGNVNYEGSHNKYYGYGRINATRAINAILPRNGNSLTTISLCYLSVFAIFSIG